MIETMRRAAFAGAVVLGSGCATDTRYHDGVLASLSDADRTRCNQIAQAAKTRAGKHSLRDLSSEDWGWAIYGGLPIYLFEIRRRNESERQRAHEAALQHCFTLLIEHE